MNAKTRIIAVLAISIAVCSCFAQGGGGRQGRRGGFGIAGLLSRADVQKDLALSDDQISKIGEARQAARAAGGGGGGGNRGGGGAPPDPAAMAARDKPFLDILTDDQKSRVKQIQIQMAGDTAATQPEVQTALALTDDQKAKIKSLQDTEREANASVREKQTNQEMDRTAAREATQKNAQTLRDEIHKVLTEAQIAKLKDLGGKPFIADTPGGGR
jgi:hypothetical protein